MSHWQDKLIIHPDGHVVYSCPRCKAGVRVQWAQVFPKDADPYHNLMYECHGCKKSYHILANGESFWAPHGWAEKAGHALVLFVAPALLLLMRKENEAATKVREWSTYLQEKWGFDKYTIALTAACATILMLGMPDWRALWVGDKAPSHPLLALWWVYLLREPIFWSWNKFRNDSMDSGEVLRPEDVEVQKTAVFHRAVVVIVFAFMAPLRIVINVLTQVHPIYLFPDSADIGMMLSWVFAVLVGGPYVPPWRRNMSETLNSLFNFGSENS